MHNTTCETEGMKMLVTWIHRLEVEPSMSVSILSVNFSITRTFIRVLTILGYGISRLLYFYSQDHRILFKNVLANLVK